MPSARNSSDSGTHGRMRPAFAWRQAGRYERPKLDRARRVKRATIPIISESLSVRKSAPPGEVKIEGRVIPPESFRILITSGVDEVADDGSDRDGEEADEDPPTQL